VYDRVLIHVDRRNAFATHVPYLRAVLRRHITREAVVTTVVEPAAPTLFGYVFDPADVARADAHNLDEAQRFLRSIADQLADEGVAVRTEVLVGDPAEAFRSYAAAGAFDLVLIAPTGRRYLLTGKPRRFRRALYGVGKPIMILPALTPRSPQAA
jgi:nucleotide-binding universal stress UspA family protein